MGYKKYYDLADKAEGAIDLARFGKKVDYSYKVSNNELMEEHLKQIRCKLDTQRGSHIVKRQQEKEFLEQLA